MSGYKKLVLIVIGILFSATVLFIYKPTRAQWSVIVLNDLPAWREAIYNRAKSTIEKAQSAVVTGIINRTLTTFANKLAYDMANNLATSGPGKTPLFERESFTKSLTTAKDAALGEFIGQLSKSSFQDLGFNLCDPSAELKLSLTLSLIDQKAPPKSSSAACNWQQVQKEWSKFGDNFTADLIKAQLNVRGGSKNLEDFFANGFSLETTGVGMFGILSDAARTKEQQAIDEKKALTQKCQGFLDNRSVITEEIRSSCVAVMQLQGMTFDLAAQSETQKIGESALKKEVGIIGSIMKTAGNIFVNTFTSKLMNRWIQGGMWSVLGGKKATNPGLRESLLAQLRGGADLDKSNNGLFVDFQKIEPDVLDSYSIFEEFASCPEDTQFRKPDNCVVSGDFLQAAASRTTLQDAIDKGLISGNLPLIGKDDSLRNANRDCYKDALCYSNLVKLRKANIIPVGWEMAALRSPLTAPVTLQQAIDCFEEGTGKCKFQPETAGGNNPFYHLIDPYWILKAPPALCNAYVYSSVLESPDTSNRQQYCADVKTCLREDANGNCLSGEYGYCTKTENIWRFTGDECKDGDIYSGCLTFQNDTLPTASYLEQSLDYCSGDQVGCKRYSQEQNNDGNWVLQDLATDDNDLFLNNKSASCPSNMAGCSEYIVMAADTGTNLVANGSFNNTDKDTSALFPNGRPDGWINEATNQDSDGVEYDGNRMANGYPWGGGSRYTGTESIYQVVPLLPNTTYRITASAARHDLAVSSIGRVSILQCDADTCGNASISKPLVGPGFGNCEVNVGDNNANLRITDLPADGSMKTGSCTFTTNGEDIAVAKLHVVADGANATWFDNIKLEIVSDPNSTTIGSYSQYGQGSKVNMNGSRFMCTQDEVGCQGYNPSNGDPMIPAVISQNDLCPQECVGYATFAETPDAFDLVENPSATYNYYNFIPSSAKSCPATVVGCEEFTNVDAVAQGGEGKEYYTYLRQCVSADLGSDYITWEGTDVAGYQIRAWKALPSSVPAAAGVPPCTNVLPGLNVCNDGAAGVTIAACGLDTPTNPLDDSNVNANCRQFFDASGNSFWRLQDRVIFASNDCHDYRRTINPSVVYKAIPSQSTQCTAAQNGCRAYYGNNSNNVRNIFSDDFEKATYAPWQVRGSGSPLDLSSESLEKNGHSLKITSTQSSIESSVGAVQNNKQYKLSWWMKSSVSLGSVGWGIDVPRIAGGVSGAYLISSTTDSSLQNTAANNWQFYTVTQYFDQLDPSIYDLNNAKIFFYSLRNGSGENGIVYLDNVMFKEVDSNIYVIRNSWTTPASCDAPYTGYHLGCQTYTDNNKVKYNLKSFQNLCRVEAIGCMAVIDTHNSDNPFAETFHNNPADPSQITVPADNIAYLVPDSNKYCAANYQGCQALGLPDKANPSYLPTVYKINDPDQYAASLCMNNDLYCEEYSSDKGTYYFKDPGTDTCTYQVNIPVGTNVVTGWFKTANLKDPLPLGCLDTDNAYDAADFVLGQKAATCPSDKNLCTTFYDPTDPVACNSVGTCTVGGSSRVINNERDCRAAGGIYKAPDCQAYYYYNNEKIDKASCAGQVNKNNGCVLFKEANNWNGDHSILNVNYDSKQSYDLNLSRASAVSPVTCNPSCDPVTDPTCTSTCTLDSNVLLKVSKDRQCSEWLACRSSSVVWDQDNNRYKVVCTDMGTCTEFDTNNNITKCAAWASVEPKALTAETYQDRATGVNNRMQFGDNDYTGYSIPDMLPMTFLTVSDFGTTANPLPRLVYKSNGVCTGTGSCLTTINGDSFNGVCRNNRCEVNPVVESNINFNVETRGYAQIDSPFPSSISPDQGRLDRLQSYAGANICEVDQVAPITASPNGCEINYLKITYGAGGTVRYYPTNFPSPGGICGSGNTDSNIDCVDSAGFAQNNLCDTYNTDGSSRNDGTCDKKIKAETIYNWPGICLEYDYNAKIVNDTNGTNYCNQWYPADQIAGTNSLYDNFREAGYYEPAGRDSLFCSVTGEFVTTENRVYCVLRGETDPDNCNALALVPSGSKINASALSSNSSVVGYGYLKSSSYNFVPAETPVGNPARNFNSGFDDGIGLDRIEKKDLSGNVSYYDSKFSATDFVLPANGRTDQVPVTTINSLNGIFVPSAGNEISVFYLDEDVDSTPHGNPNGRIWIGDRFDVGPNMPQGTENESCRDSDAGGNTGPEDTAADCDQCVSSKTWHSVVPGYCNPLSYNYYLKPEVRNQCAGTDCNDGVLPNPPGKGQACMLAATTEYSSRVACATTDLNCQFVQCIQSIHTAATPHDGGSALWCADYGSVEYSGDSYVANLFRIEDVASISSCYKYLFATSTIYNMHALVKRDTTVNDALITAALGTVRTQAIRGTYIYENINKGTDGCLESSVQTGCVGAGPMWDRSSSCRWSFAFNADDRVYSCSASYTYEVSGSSCTGMNCYQQCSVVADLDSVGDKSWVRTDIWWRNETNSGNTGRNIYPAPSTNTWLSYYYKSGFIQNSNVNYAGITGESVKFTHFGSALGFLGNDVVNVRVPFNASAFSPLAAATFFARGDSGTLSDAHSQLLYIFYKVYNLRWDAANSVYVPNSADPNYTGENIYTGTTALTNAQNTKAGPDFNPVLLRVCGSDVCRNTSNAVIEGVTLNDQQTDNIEADGSLFTSVKFYYYAHPDHMPVKNITINWGDGSNNTSAPGKYKNNIPDCNPDIAMPGQATTTKQGFGGTERACREAYKTFYHDYQYSSNSAYICDGRADGRPTVANAACYQPTVTVQDHWSSGSNFQTSRSYAGWVVIRNQ